MADKAKTKQVECGCPKCGAAGHFGENAATLDNPFCPVCNGRGRILVDVTAATKCPECNGRGHNDHNPCVPCCSTGKIAGGEETQTSSADTPLLTKAVAQNKILAAQLEEKEALIAEYEKDAKADAATIKDLKKQLKAVSKGVSTGDPGAETAPPGSSDASASAPLAAVKPS